MSAAAPPRRKGRPRKEYAPNDPREPVILRIRMRRGMLNRIKAVAAYDAEVFQEQWNVSDAMRDLLFRWLERREAEIKAAREANFMGRPPDSDDGDDALDYAIAAKN